MRVNIRWKNVEKGERGSYDWTGADELLNYYLDRDFAVMAMLTMESLCPLYANDKANQDLVIDAIARWAGAALLPDNPQKLRNDRYTVSLTDPPDNISAPDGHLNVRTYLRTYLRQGQDRERLIIALWNPVEAFDGKILDSRKRIRDHYYEAWRAVSPDDIVEIPTQVRITGFGPDRLQKMFQYNLLATSTEQAASPIQHEVEDNTVLSPPLQIGPMPTVLVADIE